MVARGGWWQGEQSRAKQNKIKNSKSETGLSGIIKVSVEVRGYFITVH